MITGIKHISEIKLQTYSHIDDRIIIDCDINTALEILQYVCDLKAKLNNENTAPCTK